MLALIVVSLVVPLPTLSARLSIPFFGSFFFWTPVPQESQGICLLTCFNTYFTVCYDEARSMVRLVGSVYGRGSGVTCMWHVHVDSTIGKYDTWSVAGRRGNLDLLKCWLNLKWWLNREIRLRS